MADTHEAGRRSATSATQVAQYSHTHYLIVGVALAALWWFSRDLSLLYHALQMLGVMSVLTAVQIVLRRHVGEAVPYLRLIAAKLVLVALAVCSEWLLSPATDQSNAIVAAGLVVLVTALGPVLDRLAARRATSTTATPAEGGVPVDHDAVLASRKD